MESFDEITEISRAIGLSLAPAFLLVGIGAILTVLTSRLGRIVDRARLLETEYLASGEKPDPRCLAELSVLDRRMASAHWAISLCTASALSVCLVVAVIFIDGLLGVHTAPAVAVLFIVATGLLIFGLLLFLVEIYLATSLTRVRREVLGRKG